MTAQNPAFAITVAAPEAFLTTEDALAMKRRVVEDCALQGFHPDRIYNALHAVDAVTIKKATSADCERGCPDCNGCADLTLTRPVVEAPEREMTLADVEDVAGKMYERIAAKVGDVVTMLHSNFKNAGYHAEAKALESASQSLKRELTVIAQDIATPGYIESLIEQE